MQPPGSAPRRDVVHTKSRQRGLRAALAAATVVPLAGCASLQRPDTAATEPDGGSRAVEQVATVARYRLDIQAPDALRKLLSEHLELARFQNTPAAVVITASELERLCAGTPAQIRDLLETEGYFSSRVTLACAGTGTGDGGLPLLRAVVEPGPRAVVGAVNFEVMGQLQDAVVAGVADARQEVEKLRRDWPLRERAVFSQNLWIAAKNSVLVKARADGYAAARWSRSHVRIDAAENRADLTIVLDSGPPFRFGAIQVEGLERYDDDTVRRLANFSAGDPYSEKTLADYQERLRKVGLFDGAVVEIDSDADHSDAAMVRVRLRERPLQQLTLSLGYSANTGAHTTVEHIQRRLFGSRWIAKNTLLLGPDERSWEGELTSHPLEGNHRNLWSARGEQLRADHKWRLSWNLRAGRAHDTVEVERTYFVEVSHSRVDGDGLITQGDAISLNAHWIARSLDSVLLPTDGQTTALQTALGSGQGSQASQGEPLIESRGPFARLYARQTWYRPLGASWNAIARIEAGQVFTRNNGIGIPDTSLFLAGGDESVRGYGYRTLGPTVDGVTTSGRSLFTASVEVASPISPKYPAYWWAAFIDAGDAADRFADLKPVVGYGIGLRWRSPVGPLRADLAYGRDVRDLRLHLSLGIAL